MTSDQLNRTTNEKAKLDGYLAGLGFQLPMTKQKLAAIGGAADAYAQEHGKETRFFWALGHMRGREAARLTRMNH